MMLRFLFYLFIIWFDFVEHNNNEACYYLIALLWICFKLSLLLSLKHYIFSVDGRAFLAVHVCIFEFELSCGFLKSVSVVHLLAIFNEWWSILNSLLGQGVQNVKLIICYDGII